MSRSPAYRKMMLAAVRTPPSDDEKEGGVELHHQPHYTLDDYTDWNIFRSRLWRNSKVWFDHVCWSLVNVVLLVAMWAAAVVGPLLARPVRWTSEALHARYERPCTSPSYGTGATHPLSAVNAETPDIHHSYLVDPQDKTGGTDLRKRGFDLDNSLLFIHLCALVYEDECILDYALQQWHLEYEIIFSNEEGNGSQAWIVYHSRATCTAGDRCPRQADGQDFIVVVFKGTSPFNLVEWMTDFTMSKIKPHGEYLPGMIHEGFYEQFQWPVYLRAITDEDSDGEDNEDNGHHAAKKGTPRPSPLQATEGFVCSKEQIDERLGKAVDWNDDREHDFRPDLTFYELVIRRTNCVIQTKFRHQTKEGPEPAIWIAGHSLGAALATIFFSHLLHSPEFPLTISKRALKGGYTFGTPRTGDARYAKEIDRHPCAQHFFNVVNANDIVCTVPLGGNAGTQDPRTLTNFWHIGTPVLLNYWPSFEVNKRWAWSNFALNAALHFALLPLQLFWAAPAKLLTWVRLPFLGPLFFLSDHFPSEYLKHLEACKDHNQTHTTTQSNVDGL